MLYQRPTVRYLGPDLGVVPFQATGSLGHSDWRTRSLRRFVDAHAGKSGVNLDNIVRELKLDISSAYAARVFKQKTGIGIREYTKKRRLASAAMSLRGSDRSIKEIAADLGYGSVQHFTRAFKTAFKISPSEYRALHNEAR